LDNEIENNYYRNNFRLSKNFFYEKYYWFTVIKFAQTRKISLSELQRRNLIVKFCLENPNKSKSETVEHFKLLGFKIPPIYRAIKRFEKQEKSSRTKFITTLSKSSWQRWESTAKPKNQHLKQQNVNNLSSKLGWSSQGKKIHQTSHRYVRSKIFGRNRKKRSTATTFVPKM
jgi:hypothetical protein